MEGTIQGHRAETGGGHRVQENRARREESFRVGRSRMKVWFPQKDIFLPACTEMGMQEEQIKFAETRFGGERTPAQETHPLLEGESWGRKCQLIGRCSSKGARVTQKTRHMAHVTYLWVKTLDIRTPKP